MDFGQCACTGKTLGRLVQPAIVALLAEEPLVSVRRKKVLSSVGGGKRGRWAVPRAEVRVSIFADSRGQAMKIM